MCRINFWQKKERRRRIIIIIIRRNGANTISLQTSFGDLIIISIFFNPPKSPFFYSPPKKIPFKSVLDTQLNKG
jgi:hypothetical protein